MPGVFPSYVSKKRIYKEQRKDNNIFYNAIIAYTLKTLRPQLAHPDQVIADSIIARSLQVMGRFKNREGRESYNFWRTDSAYRLPYLWGLKITKKKMLDDDQDCTSMCLLSREIPVTTARQAHGIMQDYTNNSEYPTYTTFARYKAFPAYSTWLGDKFPPVFDICVLSNILSFVQTYELSWTKADSASLGLIIATIKNKDHILNPSIIAPYYGNTSIILYHLARLMSVKPIPALEEMKASLIADATNQLSQAKTELEKLILINALLKWDSRTALPGVNPNEIEKSNFPFFIGNIPSILSLSLKKPLSKKEIGFYYHYCPAYNNVLLLEWLVLKNKNSTQLVAEKNQ
jgi:hypothetical protein